MAFIRKKRVGDSTYLYVVSNTRKGERIIQKAQYLGKEENLPQILSNCAIAKSLTTAELENLLYQTPLSLWNLMGQMGLGPIFEKYLSKKWGVDAAIAAQVMILNYATDRYSKNTLSDWYGQTWLPHLLKVPKEKMNKDLLCRTMDLFTDDNRKKIQAEIYGAVSGKFKPSNDILFYDITDVTFEGDNCPMAKHGYNSRHTYLPQVKLAMAVTAELIPVCHEVFAGNTKDSKTMEKSIAMVENAGIVKKTVFIFDRGICSKANFEMIESKGAQFICGFTKNSRIKTSIAALKAEDFTKIDYDISFHETKQDERRLIIFSSKKLQDEQSAFRQKRIKKVEEKLSKLSKTYSRYSMERLHERIGAICGSYRKFFEVETKSAFSFKIKQEVLDKVVGVEGRYAILTNTSLKPEDVLARYRDRNFIEMSFKDLKMFVDVRPVRHWKEQRVLAHLFLAVQAFGLRSLAQLKLRRAGLQMTATDAIHQMDKVRALVAGGKVLRLTGECEEVRKIVSAIEGQC